MPVFNAAFKHRCEYRRNDTSLSLALLEAGILFVDHIQLAFTTNDLAICTSLLDGCSYFHKISFWVETRLSALFRTYLYLKMILPLVKSYGEISTPTLSPGKILI